MKIRKIVSRAFGKRSRAGSLAGGVNAAVVASVGEEGSTTARSSSRQRIVQRGGRTVVAEERSSEASR